MKSESGTPQPQSLTNVQKLSLPANTAVGTQVSVSDGFVVSGAGNALSNGFWYQNGTASGKGFYAIVGQDSSNTYIQWTGSAWEIHDLDNGSVYSSTQDVDYPWQVELWNPAVAHDALPTLTHPANQQLTAPSTAQGGVFVADGSQDGLYTDRGVGPLAGKRYYNLLGASDGENLSVTWRTVTLSDDSTVEAWAVYDSGDEKLYYSLSDVATPDIAGSDKFVMSVSGVAYSQRGTFNGKPYYNKIGTVTSTALNAIFWSSATWHISNAIGVDLDTSTSAVATPDLASFFLGTVVTNTAWLNASDDSPASITVTSATVGQLVSGWKLGTVVYQVNGSQNGRPLYRDVLGVADDLIWDTARWISGDTAGTGNTAFPDIGSADPVASEANWEVV